MDSSKHQSAILPWTDAKAAFSTAEGSPDWKFPRYDVTAQLSENFSPTRRDTETIRFRERKEKGQGEVYGEFYTSPDDNDNDNDNDDDDNDNDNDNDDDDDDDDDGDDNDDDDDDDDDVDDVDTKEKIRS
uniref:Uncharacterized protein n=1 Tax=Vespula pensylvanica TaxID=30213 RepID=A0A834P4J7_VESPE|nr:hypothetical protein H0235_007266 [Vespula pensylvanica]